MVVRFQFLCQNSFVRVKFDVHVKNRPVVIDERVSSCDCREIDLDGWQHLQCFLGSGRIFDVQVLLGWQQSRLSLNVIINHRNVFSEGRP